MITNIKKESISLRLCCGIWQPAFKRWKIFSSYAKKIFQKFDVCLSSNLKSQRYLKSLGAKHIKYIGNIKFTESEKNINLLNKV